MSSAQSNFFASGSKHTCRPSPTPTSAICPYSRLSAMRESTIFKKYLQADHTDASLTKGKEHYKREQYLDQRGSKVLERYGYSTAIVRKRDCSVNSNESREKRSYFELYRNDKSTGINVAQREKRNSESDTSRVRHVGMDVSKEEISRHQMSPEEDSKSSIASNPKSNKDNSFCNSGRLSVSCASAENLAAEGGECRSARTQRENRNRSITPTPSFENYKNRARIPSFNEFKKQRERDKVNHGQQTKTNCSLSRSQSTPSVLDAERISRDKTRSSLRDTGQRVNLARGLRIKPSYIPCGTEPSNVKDSPGLDDSIDDNILVKSPPLDRQQAHRSISLNNLSPNQTISKGLAKQMDSDGNFWIVAPEKKDVSKPEALDEVDSESKELDMTNKPPFPKSLERLHEDSETTKSVLRSMSDVSDLNLSLGRRRKERSKRLYKSDPFSKPDKNSARGQSDTGSLSHQSSYGSLGSSVTASGSLRSLDDSHDEITQVTDGKQGSEESMLSDTSTRNTDSNQARPQNACDSEQEVGQDPFTNCIECGKELCSADLRKLSSQTCKRCDLQKGERRRTLQEIVDTEATYRRDLKILKEEFYLPIKSAGLLSPEQLSGIFLNVDELLQVNYDFLQQLRNLMTSCNDYGDDASSRMGELFLKASSQFMAFKTYCVSQANAASLLEHFERENELLRVFLQVSQTENPHLRKMNLKSFLVIPIQRITKYPLLLNRLYKATPATHRGRKGIRAAMERIEDILDHINQKTQNVGLGNTRPKQRKPDSKGCSMVERFELIKVAQQELGVNKADVSDVLVGKLQMAQPTDHTWAIKGGKMLKFFQIYAVAITVGKQPTRSNTPVDQRVFPRPTAVKQIAVVLIREKYEEFRSLREPLFLEKCVLTVDPDCIHVFELQEWNKDA